MDLLEEATNTTAFAKIGLEGAPGSGKTLTSSRLAVGLSVRYHNRAPVAFFDTEKGSDFMLPLFKEHDVPLLRVKSRSFTRLLSVIEEAQRRGCCALIIDSVTHVSDELASAWAQMMKRDHGLSPQDYKPMRSEWSKLPRAMIGARMHVMSCGRIRAEFEESYDPATGERNLQRVGTSMKAEEGYGHEPDLLLAMRKEETKDEHGHLVKDGGITIFAAVKKDRSLYVDPDTGASRGRMNGKVITNPTFEDFAPFWESLAIGGTHVGVGEEDSVEDLIRMTGAETPTESARIVLLQSIEMEFTARGISNRTDEGRQSVARCLGIAFDTMAWKAIEAMDVPTMTTGLNKLRELFAGRDACGRDDHDWKMGRSGRLEVCARQCGASRPALAPSSVAIDKRPPARRKKR